MIGTTTGANFQAKRSNLCAGIEALGHINSRRARLANTREIIRRQCVDDRLLDAEGEVALGDDGKLGKCLHFDGDGGPAVYGCAGNRAHDSPSDPSGLEHGVMANRLSFPDAALPASTEEIRTRIRAFLEAELANGSFTPSADTWLSGHDPTFSKKLGAEGFLGLTYPKQYGGQGRSALDRFVVVEELLAYGAPIAAHWIAERQSGPSILKHGNDALKEELVPGIARGEIYFSIGMSEPDSGSDLASIRSTATKVDGGWLVNGTKVWTSQAHNNQYFIVLVRTTPANEANGRHNGMSQFVFDLRSPGVQIRPIRLLSGHHHFNEVVMTDVFVPEHMLLGVEEIGRAHV